MKYIKLFPTEAEYLAAKNTLDTPNVCYAEDTGNIFYGQDASKLVIMTSETNPSVLAICYAQGWCASSDKMTLAEARAVTSIGTAFDGSSIGEFTEFQYFTGITSIPNDAFENSTVTKLYMPNTVTSLGNFRRVKNLTELKLSEEIINIPPFFSIPCPLYIPKELRSIGIGGNRNIFYSSITISEENTYLELLDGIVYTKDSVPTIQAQMYNSASISVKDGVTAIPSYFLENNDVVAILTLPSSITTIGMRFGRSARNLKNIICNATTPPTLDTSYLLQNVTLQSIKVPSGSVDAYKAASGWSNFVDIIMAI